MRLKHHSAGERGRTAAIFAHRIFHIEAAKKEKALLLSHGATQSSWRQNALRHKRLWSKHRKQSTTVRRMLPSTTKSGSKLADTWRSAECIDGNMTKLRYPPPNWALIDDFMRRFSNDFIRSSFRFLGRVYAGRWKPKFILRVQ